MFEKDCTTISIVTYNSPDIFNSLKSLQSELRDSKAYKIVIYDNGSSEEYKKKLREFEPFVALVFSSENKGFGHGQNAILLNSQSNYGVIFNPDILVTKNAMDEAVQLLKENDKLAAVSPKILNQDGTIQYLVREKLTVFDYFLRYIPIKFEKRLAKFECRNLPEDKASIIRMGSGCFMVIDIQKFKEIGGFDERFFMYFEDNDLCLRFEKKGYRILYTPFISVIHLYAKEAHKSSKMFRIFVHSMIQFFNKWGWKLF